MTLIKNLLFLLATTFGTIYAVAEQTDSIAIRLCQEADNCYNGSNGVFMNKEKAFELYKQAAEREYVPAIMRVANFYKRGEIVVKDNASYYLWILKAAQMGNHDAENRVGVCLHDGIGTNVNLSEAYEWYVKAAQAGNILAMDNLRLLCYQQEMYDEYLKWSRMGAENGYAECQYTMGNLYYNGKYFQKDYAQAKYWFRMAAQQDHAKACNMLAVILHDSDKDYASALELFRKALQLGAKKASFNLGYLYEMGHGTEIDYKKAEEYYIKAIETNNDDGARFQLGVMYYEGNDVIKKNRKRGETLLKEAANNGNADAKAYLEKHKIKWSITINGEKL